MEKTNNEIKKEENTQNETRQHNIFDDLLIGTKETTMLQPATVTIKDYKIEEITTTKNTTKSKSKKIVFFCEHPQKNDGLIKISSVQLLNNKTITTKATWLNLDTDGLLTKTSPIANLLNHLQAKTIKETINKTINTTTDDNGYLTFKTY